MNGTRNLVFMGLLVAAALALSFVESFLPSPVLPGAKIGLANIVTVAALYLLPRTRDAALVLAARVMLGGIFAGGASFLYSAAGAALSFCVMAFLKKTGKFGIVAVSAAGGFFHNTGQLLMAAATVSSSPLFFAYMPALGLAGLLAGGLVGFAAEKGMGRWKPGK
ncbi:MAG: Gx transporter family protein [Schwartzia sp.]|nr:Gx transporter family protein [Schwartzia sp. (in: firmicutes)]